MRMLDYNNQQFRDEKGFSYQSLQTTVWESALATPYVRSAMHMQQSANGMSGSHYEDRFPLKGRFSKYTK